MSVKIRETKTMSVEETIKRAKGFKPLISIGSTTVKKTSSNQEDDVSLDIPIELKKRMFSHQEEGVDWLFALRKRSPGGILGDDMVLLLAINYKIMNAMYFHNSTINVLSKIHQSDLSTNIS